MFQYEKKHMFLASAMWFLPAALEPRTNDDPGESNNPKATATATSTSTLYLSPPTRPLISSFRHLLRPYIDTHKHTSAIMSTSPHQLFLLADHIKLSLLERQRALSLKLPGNNTNEGPITRSLESLRSGIATLSAQAEEDGAE